MDQHGRPVPHVRAAQSVVMQDPRRFSEASAAPPPRPPPPNLKRLNMKPQRRTTINPIPGTVVWPVQVVMPPAAQPKPPNHYPPQQVIGGSNLAKMSNMTRSTPQLDDDTDNRERERGRSRERPPQLQPTRDSLTAQVQDRFIIVYLILY